VAEQRRVGLFGGTFNPIHLGHLRGAEEIRETFDLREIIFIPAAIPPHKTLENVADSYSRLEMARQAAATNPLFSVSDAELERPGKSYSVDTVRSFLAGGPDSDFFFILGRDAFAEIETWMEYQELFSLCNFVVMVRSGFENTPLSSRIPKSLAPVFRYDEKGGCWVHRSGHRLYFKEILFLDISSTRIRELIGQGRSVRYLVPEEVGAYIDRKGLYRKAR